MSPDESQPTELAFRVHGVPLRLTCESTVVADALVRRLAAFVVDAVPADAVAVTITGPDAPPLVSAETLAARVVYEGPAGELRYLDAGDRLVSDYAGQVQIDLAPATAPPTWP